MESPRRAPGYDLFKSIVAIILLVIFFLLNARTTPQSPTPISTIAAKPSTTLTIVPTPFGNAGLTAIPGSSTSLSLTSTTTPLPSATVTNEFVSTQTPLLSPTTTIASAETIPPLPSPIVTESAAPTATPPLSSTATPAPSSTSTPIPGTAVASACESASSRSRLQNGTNAIILRRLNFRSSPGIGNNWLLTNIPGTKVEVVDGPECAPHFAGAYVWWQIKLPDGQIGWSAEASQFGSFYFMEPEK